MSSTESEDSANPEPNLTPAEFDDLDRLEAVAQSGIESYVQVGNALAEIRDRHLYRDGHLSFESYARERWGIEDSANRDARFQTTIDHDARATPMADPRAALHSTPCEALARVCEQTLSALDDDERLAIEIGLAIRKNGGPGTRRDGPIFSGPELSGPMGGGLVPQVRWLLAQATGKIAQVSHQLEGRAVDFDDGARAQLRDDILLLDGELAVVRALLSELIDWDSELSRLLDDDVPPFDSEADAEDDD